MPLIELIQRIVNFIDFTTSSRTFRVGASVLLFVTRCLWLDVHDYHNFATPEAMDNAQLARNLAEGRGYTTELIRPLSLYMMRHWQERITAGQPPGANPDPAGLQTGHPDLANPPVYPLFLAAAMNVLPFNPAISYKKPFWSEGGHFARYQPDFLIATLNQLLLAVVLWQSFWVARKLFGTEVAWTVTGLLFACDLLWDCSAAGLPNLLVMVILLSLTHLLIAFEAAAFNPATPLNQLFGMALAAGVLAALGALTDYAFGWVLLPVILFLLIAGGPRRWTQVLWATGAFVVVLTPWMYRNYQLCGSPFGTAGYAMLAGTPFYPDSQLEQSLHPDTLVAWFIKPYFAKLWPNLDEIVEQEWPRLGGGWVGILFFAGLLWHFGDLPVSRLRYFLMACVATFSVTQAMIQSSWRHFAPAISPENLLLLLVPLVAIYGTAYFYHCLDQIDHHVLQVREQLRTFFMVVFLIVMCLPAAGRRLGERTNPVAFPPYYPPEIQMASNWMKPDELMMSDVPWAVAWYGHRQCLWLTLNTVDDFYAMNDFVKPIRALYLTPLTLDKKLLSECLQTRADSWGKYVLNQASQTERDFPLRVSPPAGVINSGLFVTDHVRWLDVY